MCWICMARGPLASSPGFQRSAFNPKSVDSGTPLQFGGLSGCLRDAGADVVAKNSQGAVLKTNLSRRSFHNTGEITELQSKVDVLRCELEERDRQLQALQIKHDDLATLLAKDRERIDCLENSKDELFSLSQKHHQEEHTFANELHVARSDNHQLNDHLRLAEHAAEQQKLTSAHQLAELNEMFDAQWKENQLQARHVANNQRLALQALELELTEAHRRSEGSSRELEHVRALANSKERLLAETEQDAKELSRAYRTHRDESQMCETQLRAELWSVRNNLQELHGEYSCSCENAAKREYGADSSYIEELKEHLEKAEFTRDAAILRADTARTEASKAYDAELSRLRGLVEQLTDERDALRLAMET